MFADSLLESNWDDRSHRGWTTLASFTMQGLAVGILLMLPFGLRRRIAKTAPDHDWHTDRVATGTAGGRTAASGGEDAADATEV